jgi:hypothetical protein
MDVDPLRQYTILRIKRKRTEEPLDALVVESRSRKKKSRGDLNVFQFAQTVEHDAWADEKRRQDLQEQISKLAKESSTPLDPSPATSPIKESKFPLTSRQQKDDASRRYTIVKQDNSESERRRLPTSPPKVISHKDLPSKKTDFKLYDAILSGSDAAGPPAPIFDSEMDKFMPMLTDYLKIHDMTPPGSPSAAKSFEESSAAVTESKSEGDDYVWDVFYHRPTKLSEWNAIANIGTLTGLPPSTTDPYDSDSDTEPEDEADEDSNEEEYYKNDYPDEEDDSDSSDMFHEQSDHDEEVDESFDESEWR